MSKQRKPRREALVPYRDAGLKGDLIPLHHWDHRDEKGERGKSPRDAKWRRRMYTLEEIATWAKDGGNVGFRIPPGWIVFDLDPRNVPEGQDVVAMFELEYGVDLAKYPCVRTGSGGFHAYGRAPMDLRVRNALDELPGIEFKAVGRQVVTPGSIHPCGEYYEWIDGTALKDAPEWPAAMLNAIKRVETATGGHQEEISLAEAEALLHRLAATDFQDHDRWLELMMAFHSATGGAPEAREIFAEWSTADPAYANHGPIIRQRWDTLRAREGGVTVGTLYHRVIEKFGSVPPAPPEAVFSAVGDAAYVPTFDRDKNLKVKNTDENATEALKALDLGLAYDEFKTRMVLRGECRALAQFNVPGRVWDDHVALLVKTVIMESFQFAPTLERVHEAAARAAHANRVNELLEYFESLRWDGTPRLDTWLSTYTNAEDIPYVRAVGRCMFLGATARGYHPGIKFDSTVILEGWQGQGKSKMLKILSDPWYLEGLSARLDKDELQRMQGHLFVELGEMTVLRNSEVSDMKLFLTREVDTFRPSYGRTALDFPRRNIFIGTTNETTYLIDSTGNRRFLPVKVGMIDLNAIERDRDQLWAEAVNEWKSLEARQRRNNKPLYEALFLPAKLWAVAAAEQEDRRNEDPWEDVIRGHLDKLETVEITTESVFDHLMGVGAMRSLGTREIKRLVRVMAKLGWRKQKVRAGGRNPVSGFKREGGFDGNA